MLGWGMKYLIFIAIFLFTLPAYADCTNPQYYNADIIFEGKSVKTAQPWFSRNELYYTKFNITKIIKGLDKEKDSIDIFYYNYSSRGDGIKPLEVGVYYRVYAVKNKPNDKRYFIFGCNSEAENIPPPVEDEEKI